MLPIDIRYFRFDALTNSDGDILFAPPNFTGVAGYYFGYDLAKYTIKYTISRDIDSQTDSFTIIVDKSFFNNPYGDSKYANSTDPVNTFQPTVNHVIVIGAIPSGANADFSSPSYNYDDKESFSSPMVGMITNYNDTNSGYTQITCVSLLKALNDRVIGTNFNINSTDDTINHLQIYYEYNTNPTLSSDPYFAAKNTNSLDKITNKYKIALPNNTDIDDKPLFPEFSYIATATTITRIGYALPKIAWRILQEIGWCKRQYVSQILSDTGATNANATEVNPFQIFTIPIENFNENTMIAIGQKSQIMFKSFDTDGLRYDYTYVGDLDPTIQFSQSYVQSFDPSKQSVLYNMKTMAELDGNYIYLTCCPSIQKNTGEDFPEIAWDANVYGQDGSNNVWGNLARWGVYAGFHPKVMIKANPKFENIIPDRQLYYGLFNDNPILNNNSVIMAQSAHWASDNENTINKLQIQYGQTLYGNESYIELPERSVQPAFYSLIFTGSVVGTGLNIDLRLLLGQTYSNQFEINRDYSVGVTASEIVRDFVKAYDGTDVVLTSSIDELIVQAPSVTATMVGFWNSQQDPLGLFAVALNNAVTGGGVSYTIEYLGAEPTNFDAARTWQKQYGVKETKITMPEVSSLVDIYKISDKIFQKLAYPKYRLTTTINNTGGGSQLPLFEYFEVIDTSNTKQIINNNGAEIDIKLTGPIGQVGYSGVLSIAIPSPTTPNPQMLTISIANTDTIANILTNVYNAYYPAHPSLTSIYAPSMVISGSYIKLTYGTEVDFAYIDAFNNVSATTTVTGLSVTRTVTEYNLFTTTTYDEYLLLLDYVVDSSKAVYSCIFGLPNESIANIVNQIQGWVYDVAKST